MLLVCKLKAFVSEKEEMHELRKESHCFCNKLIEEFDSSDICIYIYEKIKLKTKHKVLK